MARFGLNLAGNPRNFQVFKPFDFLAEVTQLARSEVEGTHLPRVTLPPFA